MTILFWILAGVVASVLIYDALKSRQGGDASLEGALTELDAGAAYRNIYRDFEEDASDARVVGEVAVQEDPEIAMEQPRRGRTPPAPQVRDEEVEASEEPPASGGWVERPNESAARGAWADGREEVAESAGEGTGASDPGVDELEELFAAAEAAAHAPSDPASLEEALPNEETSAADGGRTGDEQEEEEGLDSLFERLTSAGSVDLSEEDQGAPQASDEESRPAADDVQGASEVAPTSEAVGSGEADALGLSEDTFAEDARHLAEGVHEVAAEAREIEAEAHRAEVEAHAAEVEARRAEEDARKAEEDARRLSEEVAKLEEEARRLSVRLEGNEAQADASDESSEPAVESSKPAPVEEQVTASVEAPAVQETVAPEPVEDPAEAPAAEMSVVEESVAPARSEAMRETDERAPEPALTLEPLAEETPVEEATSTALEDGSDVGSDDAVEAFEVVESGAAAAAPDSSSGEEANDEPPLGLDRDQQRELIRDLFQRRMAARRQRAG